MRRRSCDTYFCSVLAAVGGGRPSQTSSTSRSAGTTVPASSSRRASTARWRGPPSGTRAPPEVTSSGPRIPNCIGAVLVLGAYVFPPVHHHAGTAAGDARARWRPPAEEFEERR